MDFQFWLYVIIGVIYLLSRVLKKKAPETPEVNEHRPVRESPGSSSAPKAKPLTFEELLREITEAKQVEETQSRRNRTEPEVIDYDDQVGEEIQTIETIDNKYGKYGRTERAYEVYEESKKQAFERLSLEETMKLRDTDVKFGKFKEFEEDKKKNLLEEYTKDFRDPEGLKKAVVMAEILNRKF